MQVKYTYWKDEDWYLGFLNDYPDYQTQGKNLPELQDMLKSLLDDINSGDLPYIRRVAELNYEEKRTA
jgi:hypothetical protein